MSTHKTETVCGACFHSTSGLSAKLSKSQCKNRNEVICKTCRKKWNSINVAFSGPDNTWYQIRSRPNKHKTDICRAIINNKQCPTGNDCKFPHNYLEKDAWEIATENFSVKKDKFSCFVCNITFQQQKDLNVHMNSLEHGRCAEKKRLLPKVGSSTEFKGLVRDRPNLPQSSDEYQLCSDVTKGTKCRFRNACRFAHSIEERTAWNEALRAENEDTPVEPVEERNWNLEGDTRRGNTFFIKKEDTTFDSLPRTPSKQKGQFSPRRQVPMPVKLKDVSNIPKFIREITNEVNKKEISCYLKNNLTQIKLHCDSRTDVTINANSTDDVTWIIRLTAGGDQQLNAVVLYNHRKCFQIGQVTVRDPFVHKQQIHTPLHPTGTILELDLNEGTTVEVPVTFIPQPGEYSVFVIFQLIYGTLLAFQLQVKVVEERFIAPTTQFTNWLTEEKKSIQQFVSLMKVLWEHEYKIQLFPSHREARSTHNTRHPIPYKMENRISSGTYNTMDSKITADSYKQRFHELLFLEEYEHRKRLVKYDLQDYNVTFDTATKQISYSTPRSQCMKTAPQNLRYITFKLKYNLFEGYRSYKPPSQAFLIPNATDTAYECSHFFTGVDFMHFLVTEAAIAACEKAGGRALVRFTPERDEYVRMHDALDKINPRVMFPAHKKIPIRGTWEERAILEKAEKENLTESQKEAIYSIVDTEYQTFPTIVCGPFGCGKTRTLAIAARLIALNFHGAKVLVVTKNNSCANLFIELLSASRQFDSIVSYRNKILTDIANVRPILYRHFAKSSKIGSDKTILEYTQYKTEGDTPIYKILSAEEMLICSVIVTTTHGCYSLVQLREELRRELDLFTHVFIDEAAQIIEPDACIPLHFANDRTKVVLAGDIYQTRPLILSPLALKHGMDKSVLERFSEFVEYDSNPLSKCRIELRENFRSQEPVVKFLSKLFYNNSITANPPKLTGPSNLPYLSMVHVNGQEERIEIYGHVSYCNHTEAQLTLKAVERFVSGGVDPSRIMVLSTYRGHQKLIESYLRSNKCRGVGKHQDRTGGKCRDSGCVNDKTIRHSRLEGVQGLEYDVLIINTVRTIRKEPSGLSLEGRLDLGLLDDVAQFNTVLTRARGWVMVIGDTECLTAVGGCSEMWRQYKETCSQLDGLFPNGDITAGKYDKLFETSGLSGGVVERDKDKSGLLEMFISICSEELCSSITADNPRQCQSLSKQIELAERALYLINKQTENTREQYTYKKHSYPTNPSPVQPVHPTEAVPYSYAGAVNTRHFGPRSIPQRLVPEWVQPSYTPYISGVYPHNQMSNYY